MLFEDLLKGVVVAQRARKMILRSLRWKSKFNSNVNFGVSTNFDSIQKVQRAVYKSISREIRMAEEMDDDGGPGEGLP